MNLASAEMSSFLRPSFSVNSSRGLISRKPSRIKEPMLPFSPKPSSSSFEVWREEPIYSRDRSGCFLKIIV